MSHIKSIFLYLYKKRLNIFTFSFDILFYRLSPFPKYINLFPLFVITRLRQKSTLGWCGPDALLLIALGSGSIMTSQKCMTFDLILFSRPWILIDIHRHMNEKLTRRRLNSCSRKEKNPKTGEKFIRLEKNLFRNNKTSFLFFQHTKESSKIESRNLLTVFMLTSLSRRLLCYC